MNKNIFERLAVYNKEVNQKMNEIIKTLSDEEWNRQFSGYFKSIRELCSHIFIADYRMFKEFRSAYDVKHSDNAYFDKEYTYRDTLFKDINDYITTRNEFDALIIDFVKEMVPDNLNSDMNHITSKGTVISKKLDVFLMTIFNHQTHHRGMVSLYLEMLGKENDYSRFLDYV
ncbi:MAG: DinB family protein [Treponema sp.]|jgi:uncharacterized damage-inducible protein DinB|nr:DinB family protein [Treponema sp.]